MKKLLSVLGIIAIIVALTPSSFLMSCNNEGNGEPDGDSIQPPAPRVDSIAVKDTTVKN